MRVAVDCIGLGLVVLCSLPSIHCARALFRLRRQDASQPDHYFDYYEDEDGISTREAVTAYSARAPKAFTLFFAFSGTCIVIALNVLREPRRTNHEFALEGWSRALCGLQALCIAASRKPPVACRLGLYSLLSSVLVAGMASIQGIEGDEDLLGGSPLLLSLRIAEFVALVLLGFSSIAIPRRPDVFYHGRLVDQQSTVSVLSRFTWSWPAALIRLAAERNDLDLQELPRPGQSTRAQDITEAWKADNHNGPRPLWKALLFFHWQKFSEQWFFAVLQAVSSLAPQWVIWRLLRLFERRHLEPLGVWVWIWVALLGVSVTTQALIFEKAIRRRDVKEAGSSGSKSADESGKHKKVKQGAVNLVGVDAKHVSNCCTTTSHIPGSVVKLALSLVLLIGLLGWKPLLAGFGTMVACLPVNLYLSRRYAAAQGRLMKIRDEKLGVVSEAVQGIRHIKFAALEPQWEFRVNDIRRRELVCVWDVCVSNTYLIGCWAAGPILLAVVSLATYAEITGELTPSVAFVSLGVFKALEATLSFVPGLVTGFLDAWISLKRIDQYLQGPEMSKIVAKGKNVSFEGASIAWPTEGQQQQHAPFVLRDIKVSFPEGCLSVIAGPTGSGKSLLLSAILGECDLLEGKIYAPAAAAPGERHDERATKADWILPGAIAYVAQIPWIENATIKENILFDLPLDEERYQKVTAACALTEDFKALPDGDNTEVGANGVNLSGGQRWRVTLGRALYSRAKILVMDDIFSAVDAHVGRHVLENALADGSELAAGRTRILATHHVGLCRPKTKYLVELRQGTVVSAGPLSDVGSQSPLKPVDGCEPGLEETQKDTTGRGAQTALPLQEGRSVLGRKFVQDEKRARGSVKSGIYATYLKASGGWLFWIFILALFVLMQGLGIGRSWWLRVWTGTYEGGRRHENNHGLNLHHEAGHEAREPIFSRVEDDLGFYLGIYVLLAVAAPLVGTLRFLCLYLGSLAASRRLFAKMVTVVLRAPIIWLDTVPVGRILNRFTADFNVIDSSLANSLGNCANALFNLLGVIVSGFFVSFYIIPLALVLMAISRWFSVQYLRAARPSKRLESTTKSPVFEQFGSAMTGVTTVRAFDKSSLFIGRMHEKLDDYAVATWYLRLFNRWFGWRMAVVGSTFAIFVASAVVLAKDMDAALAGFALTFALEFSGAVMWAIRQYSNVELTMNAAERIIEYTDLPTEPLGGVSPPAAWPQEGTLEVNDLVVGYADDLPPVLRRLTFRVDSNERVGIVGRTGAGKSSLTLALFRFLEARSGTIHIDGLDISKIKLHDLRSRLAIIPQDPVLFSGTVRENLDPFGDYSDAELRDALGRVHLRPTFERQSPAEGLGFEFDNADILCDLESHISEGGLDISQGQRQLLCLARAIVRRPKIIVLDEATSAVDTATDALIQQSIRDEFPDSTLLVIAHRLSTIADFDRILVLADGQVAEYGSPRELWGSEGLFRSMCEESGESEKLRAMCAR
ncbi:P-loop containing nucleoside triphosphate hydrolase protein [Chaetomium tenue]|uniref:P-loop containing nucleoside triphosphate hydrolase protein n=1 Tax=Chaetomium tenue TaxID=1854479 RepID=A0ACB7PCE0_9PEZI|nr:P-loop containing nucleoside triphosphate hydrolase protein [Chaetomium globosum]